MHSFQQILILNSEIQNSLFPNYKFPISPEVRFALGPWIEQTHIFEQFANLSRNDPNVKSLIANLYIELEAMGRAPEPVIIGSNDVRELIACSASDILINYPANAISLFEEVRAILLLEGEVLQCFAPGPHQMGLVDHPQNYTWSILEDFKGFSRNLHQVPVTSDQFLTTVHEFFTKFDQELEKYYLKLVNQLTPRTTVKLMKWKEDKQKLAQGKLTHNSLFELKHLKVYYEYYANQLWCLWYLIKSVQDILISLPECLKILLNRQYLERALFWKLKIEEQLRCLVTESLVVSIQPFHCTRRDTKIKHKVQLLVGEQIRSPNPIQIKCFTVDEIEGMKLKNYPGVPSSECITITPNADFFEMSDDGDYCANFKRSEYHGTVKRLKTTDEAFRNTKLYDENYWVYFYAEFRVENIQFQISTFSHPFKLTATSSQDCEAMETVFFDIALGRFGVESILNRPTAVPYQDYELALNYWFKNMTGRALDPADLLNIQANLLSSTYSGKLPMTELSLEHLRMPIPGTQSLFNIWEWMFGITKLIWTCLGKQKRDQFEIPGLWESGVLQNLFRTQSESKSILEGKPDGGIVLRVSYTTLSAITIDFVARGEVYSHRITIDDLRSRSLMDRIRDIPVWKILYPQNISRDYLFLHYALRNTASTSTPFDPRYVPSIQAILEKFISVEV